ncbi:MAG: hypothetical protein A2946_03315 [Candidatus Liptonbacteria bacterium RIFCSPLOWO2_01_FULL_53_13]|uniref:Uncharacterized protein n=1 Tax=Candidatus Liptonbacteria bacterium RIFCSPLOWO2_01_FULL_53_13 TaxID=1798651 RepID=A0A1G2CH66_9BACT|nr:MAG: hypothetical protein A2946_03315 [Candidatus Liptonbacteria bacterium RIFCSPLOWO2_01_FULL_53_13]
MSMNFSEYRARAGEWVSARKKELVLGGIIFIVSSLSFGLGYLANREFNRAPIVIEKCSQ